MDSSDPSGNLPARPALIMLPFADLVCSIEPRFLITALLIMPLYILAAFVGNDWAYMLPCTLLAALIVGLLLPLLEVMSLSCACRIQPKAGTMDEQEILLQAKRLPFFGLLSNLIPSGYLNAYLHLKLRSWKDDPRAPAIVPLPVVLQSLSQGLEVRLRVPSLRRGVYEADSLEISTCFPFALVWWSRRIPLERGHGESCITVLPHLHEIAGNFHSRLNTARTNAGRSTRSWMQQHRSSTLKGLREFTERDSLNQIHWASSARSGKFLVREFEVESLPDFDVYLDLGATWNEKQFDLACTVALALIHYGYRLGFSPQLQLTPPIDWEPLAEQLADIPPGCAGEELAAEMLARLSPLPAELQKEYRSLQAKERRNTTEISADLSSTPRTLLAIAPLEKSGNSPSAVSLLEKQSNCGMPAGQSPPLAQLEDELELCRI